MHDEVLCVWLRTRACHAAVSFVSKTLYTRMLTNVVRGTVLVL